jgi:hypothetical protein
MVFDLAQYDFYISSTVDNVMLWGVANSLANKPSLRPTGLAMKMLNSAIAGDFYPATAANAGAITAGAFLAGSNWSLAIASANPSATTLNLSLPASGAPPSQAFSLSAPTPLSTNDVTAGNPTGDPQVSISSIPFTGTQITIPPYGFVVLLPNGALPP